MNKLIAPGSLGGTIAATASKSIAHRLLILAAFGNHTCTIDCRTSSEDIDATVSCLKALGARIARSKTGFRVVPIKDIPEQAVLDCGESGSTLRFLLPIVSALGTSAQFVGHGRLAARPLTELIDTLRAHGSILSKPGSWPLEVAGQLRPGRHVLPGNVSSQFVSGLLLAAPLLKDTSEILVSEPFESEPYVRLTTDALATFGINTTCQKKTLKGLTYRCYRIEGQGAPFVSPRTLSVEGDWSNAAFWLVAAAIGTKPITVKELNLASSQGDRIVMAALSLFRAQLVRGKHAVSVGPTPLKGAHIDVSNCPDLVPPLAVCGACAEGTTCLAHAGRLRLKESDRLQTVSAALRAVGAEAHIVGDDLYIKGNPQLTGGVVDAAGDHRIAMMAAILATQCISPTLIKGAESVAKSYPQFFEDFASLGGQIKTQETSDAL